MQKTRFFQSASVEVNSFFSDTKKPLFSQVHSNANQAQLVNGLLVS